MHALRVGRVFFFRLACFFRIADFISQSVRSFFFLTTSVTVSQSRRWLQRSSRQWLAIWPMPRTGRWRNMCSLVCSFWSSMDWPGRQTLKPGWVGVHPRNRDGISISCWEVESLCRRLLYGFCNAELRCVCFEIDPSNVAFKQFNQRLIGFFWEYPCRPSGGPTAVWNLQAEPNQDHGKSYQEDLYRSQESCHSLHL